VSATPPVRVLIPGRPIAKGSLRVGRSGQVFSVNPGLKAWQERVALAVSAELDGAAPHTCPVALTVTFTFQRPPSHFTKSGRLRKGAALAPGRPDLDKLLRALLDGLTGVLFRDDAQVSELDAVKTYGDNPGVTLAVTLPDYSAELER